MYLTNLQGMPRLLVVFCLLLSVSEVIFRVLRNSLFLLWFAFLQRFLVCAWLRKGRLPIVGTMVLQKVVAG